MRRFPVSRRRITRKLEQLEKRELLAANVLVTPPCFASDPIHLAEKSGLAQTNSGNGGLFIGPLETLSGNEDGDNKVSDIEDGDPQSASVSVSIADASIVEGNAGAQTLSFDVSLSAAAAQNVTVDVNVTNQDADALIVQRIVNGLLRPTYATVAPGDPDTLFVVEQDGLIKRLNLLNNSVAATPFLTVSDLSLGGERGLLGLAFHPNYENNGLLYINMTQTNGDTLIRQYTARPDGLTADPNSATPVLSFDQPFSNHNGGWIDFGPDGYLYIASGDGGSGNDPQDNALDITNNLLGKLLRIDVDDDDFPSDAQRNYSIPATNPFVNVSGDDEIWAFGLRNPWRNSFDRETGDLLIADVGQNIREEINFQPAESLGGENYGWRDREGTIATPSVGGPKPTGAIDPIYDYIHTGSSTGGFSVTGGYVYRGPIEELDGMYFFADYVNNRIWSLRPDGSEATTHDGTNYTDFTDWTSLLSPDVGRIRTISSFAEDAVGNLYLVDRGGEIFRISEGSDYQITQQSVTIPVGQTTAQFQVEVVGDRLAESDETFLVSLANANGADIADGNAIGTIVNDDAPEIVETIVADASQQRSMVTEISLRFNTAVDIDNSAGDAFELVNQDSLQRVNITPVIESDADGVVVTFGFAPGPSVESNASGVNSLADGRYRLTVSSSRVELGVATLDGNGDGIGGDDFVFGSESADGFFRLLGDGDGNGVVDGQDLGRFGQTYLTSSTDPNFDSRFDFDNDGDVDGLDYTRFRTRLTRRIW